MSSDGTKATACVNGGRVYTSVNGGVDWTVASTPSTSNLEYYSITMSTDGSKIYTGASGNPIIVGTFNGTNAWTWTTLATSPNPQWFSFSVSADGLKVVAGTFGGKIYTSIDGGATAFVEQTPPVSGKSWRNIASSSDGTKVVIVANNSGTVIAGAYY